MDDVGRRHYLPRMKELSDDALLALAREGDRAALEALLARYQPLVHRYASSMCRQPQDAEGVSQETLLAAARSVGGFRGDASASTWLFTIARSFCIKRRRRHSLPVTPLHESEPAAVAPSPEDSAADQQLHEALIAAIGALDLRYREVLVLRDVEGLSAAEVADITGLSVANVKSRLHRARRSVREAMEGVLGEPALPRGPDCPDMVALYSRYLEDDLDPAVCARMQEHLAGCSACSRSCDGLKQTLALCRAGPSEPVPERVQAQVRERLKEILGPV